MQLRYKSARAFHAAAFTAFAAASFAEADRFKREYPVEVFAVTSTEAEIGVDYNYFGEKIKGRGSDGVRYDNHYLQEYYAGRANGYFYHPRFISYSAGIKLGLAQQRLHREGPDGDNTRTDFSEPLGYDVRLDFLQDHPVSGTLHSRQDELILMGLFVDRFLVRTRTHSATVRWNTENLQMDATGTHQETEEFGTSSNSQTQTDTIEYNLHHTPTNRIRTDLQYRLQKYDRQFRADTTTGEIKNDSELSSQNLHVSNRINLDAKRESYLRSTLRFNEQQNNQDLKSYFWQEHLQLQNTRNLRSYVTGSALRNDYSDRTVNTYQGESGLDHSLFESLKSHLDIHGRKTDFDNNLEEDRYGATGRLNYRKATLWGVFSAGYTRTLDRVSRTGETGSTQIFDEPMSLDFGRTSYLSNEDVIPGSVIVTDAENQVTFTENFDYEIRVEGDRTGLRLLPGGQLAEGQRVLVDYRIDVKGDLNYVADDQDITVRHDFEKLIPGLSLYFRQHDEWARDVDSDADVDLLEYRDRTYGLRQQWRDFAFTSEYQEYSSNTDGYDQWRNQIEGNHGLTRRLRWGWNAGIDETKYDTRYDSTIDDHSRFVYAGTHMDGTFARNGFWRLEGRTMKETGRTERTLSGLLARVGIKWRRMTIEAGARFEQTEVFDSGNDRSQVFISFKRSLGRQPGERRR